MKLNPFKSNKHRAPVKPAMVQRGRLVHDLNTDPFLDWFLIVMLTLLVALTLVAVGVSVYLSTGDTLSAPPAAAIRASIPTINTQALQGILDEFDRRTAERASAVKDFQAPKDPSLP